MKQRILRMKRIVKIREHRKIRCFYCRLQLQIQTLLDGLNLLEGRIGAALVAAGALEAGILDLAVELDLRLGA